MTPQSGGDSSSQERRHRPKSASSRLKTVQIQAEPPPPIKSALRSNRQDQISAKSVGVGSHNIHEDSQQALSSNQDQHLQQNQLQFQQSINNSENTVDGAKKDGAHTSRTVQPPSLDKQKKKQLGLKTRQMFLHKNYQSSEERGQTALIMNQEKKREVDQLSDSSRQSSLQKQPYQEQPYEGKHMELARQLAPGDLVVKRSIPEAPKFTTQQTTAGSTNKKSSAFGSTGSMKRATLSQEQVDMIMLHSEQEGVKQKPNNNIEEVWNIPTTKSPLPPPPSILPSKQIVNDINNFFDNLKDEASISIQVANNINQEVKINVISNEANDLSDLYHKIMSDNGYDTQRQSQKAKTSPSPLRQSEKQVKPSQAEEKKDEVRPFRDPEQSILTDFNPPTQRIGMDRTMPADLSFQSGISDLRRALEEEENYENVSDCSFINPEKKNWDQQMGASNVLDKGQFVASQNNSQHYQSIGCLSQNNSHMQGGGRHLSQGPSPMVMQLISKQQNNSMHFNGAYGNSFTCQQKYQSDDENAIGGGTTNMLSKLKGGRGNDLQASLKKFQVPPPSSQQQKAPVLANLNVRASQSQQRPSTVEPFTVTNAAGAGIGSVQSDSSAGVVLMSQNSLNTKQHSSENNKPIIDDTSIVQQYRPPPPIEQKQKLMDLFKEDTEIQSQSPPKYPHQLIDETQTDLENGFPSTKKQVPPPIEEDKNDESNTFQGLSSVTEHRVQQHQQQSETVASQQDPSSSMIDTQRNETVQSDATNAMKQTIMKKLFEIMDDKDESASDGSNDNEVKIIEKRRDEQLEIIKKHQPFTTQQSNSASSPSMNPKPSARRNTRYGDAEDSLIQFDLTSSKIVEDGDDDLSIVVLNKKGQRTRRDYGKPAVTAKGSDSDHQQNQQQRKSLKMQIQEQIQSIVVSESSSSQSQILQQAVPAQKQNQQLTRKTLLSELEAVSLPQVKLRPAFEDEVMSGEVSYQIYPETDSALTVANSMRSLLNRKYKLNMILSEKLATKSVGEVNKNDTIHELDSISRIYNELEIVPEEDSQQMKSLASIRNEEVKQQLLEDSPAPQKQIVPSLWNNIGSSYLPPLMKVNSEDEGEGTGRGGSASRRNLMQEMFYNKPSSRRNSQDNQEQLEGNGAVPIQSASPAPFITWSRDEKHNRSTATPLFSYATSSDEEGGTIKNQTAVKYSSKKMIRMLNQLHNSSVIQQPSPQTQKNGLQPQKTLKDGFKTQNLSTHTDSSERLKENLKNFGKNKLLKEQQKKQQQEQQQ